MCYEVEVVQVVKRSVASLSIVVADAHTALIADDGTSVAEQRAMPSFAPPHFIIDLETGRITNWHKPELADVQAYIRESAHGLAKLEQSIAQSKAVFAELEPQSKAIAQRLRDLDSDLPDDYNQGMPKPDTGIPVSVEQVQGDAEYDAVDAATSEAYKNGELSTPATRAIQEDTGGRSAVKPRYQHPITGETWTGRGKQPAWLQAEIAQGAAIDDFLIPAALSLCTLKKPLAPAQIDIEEQIASETAKDLPQAPAPEEVELEDGCKVISVEKRGLRWYAKHGHNSSRSEISKEGAVKTLLKKLDMPDAESVLMPNQAAEESNTWRYKVSAPAPVCDIAPMATDAEPEPKYPPVAEIAPVIDVISGYAADAVKPPTYAEMIDAINYAKTTVQAAALVGRINEHRGYEERSRLHDALRIRMAKLQDETEAKETVQ